MIANNTIIANITIIANNTIIDNITKIANNTTKANNTTIANNTVDRQQENSISGETQIYNSDQKLVTIKLYQIEQELSIGKAAKKFSGQIFFQIFF